ncbi:transposase [Gigaspora margarita]|uniref:Transposase n=1 Tax=Gigaspora margarita TaxID=4874 RepID=A0A8H4APZ4_GIGMA|nr:transposase [Gigaspora margarita]
MVKRANRRIRSKTTRAMLGWSHYRFKQRLINKTREYLWCKVTICDEHYTSKTCGNCGYLHKKLGSNKTFECTQCQIEIDRDFNAARNIVLRFLTLNRAESSDSVLGPTL